MLLLKTVVVNAAAALLPHFKIYIHTVRYKIFKKYAIWASYGLDCLCLLFASSHLELVILENSHFFPFFVKITSSRLLERFCLLLGPQVLMFKIRT